MYVITEIPSKAKNVQQGLLAHLWTEKSGGIHANQNILAKAERLVGSEAEL